MLISRVAWRHEPMTPADLPRALTPTRHAKLTSQHKRTHARLVVMLRCCAENRAYRLHERLVPSLTCVLRTTRSHADLGAHFEKLHHFRVYNKQDFVVI